MTILTTIPNNASYKDIRDTWNAALADIVLLKQGAVAPLPTVYFDQPTISASEGNSGTKVLTMTLLRSTSVGAIAVTATFSQGTAGAADFASNALPGNKVFTFADGATSATATLSISGDTDVEDDETFSYQLVAPSGYVLGSPNKLTGTILNDDTAALPTVTLSAATSSANEGGAGATLSWVYTVTRSTGAGSASVAWSFAAGSTNAADWSGGTLPTGGTVTFAAGETSKSFSVISAGDTALEPDESFTVSISAPGGYAAGATMSATGTILNDDTAQPTGLIFLATGDSKLVGNPREAQDVAWPNVYNYRSRAPVGVTADIPFDQGIARDSENRLSLMEYMAKKVAEDTGLPVYVVSHGWNGTKVAAANTSSSEWGVGNGMHETFIDRLNGTGNYAGIGAIKAILAARPGAVVAGMIRVLGTNDALSTAGTFTQAAWRDRVLAEDADYKARIFANGESGAKIGNVPTYFLGLLPETLSAARTSSGPAVELANREAAATIVGGRYFPMVRGYSTDNLHETPAGIRIAGTELAKLRADTTPAVISSPDAYSIYSGQRFAMELKADRYAWFSVSGPDADKFEVTWYTETEDAGVGGANYHFVLRFKNDVTKSYASPDDANLDRVYDINVVAKTGAGVVTTKRLLLTVEQAFGTASTGAPVVTAMGGSAETRNLFSPSTIGGVNFGRGLNLLSFLSNPSLQQFTSIRVNGQDAVMLKASTSGDPISVWAVPIATPGTYQVDLKFDGVNVTTQFANALVTNVKSTPTATDFLNFGYRSGSDLTYTTPSITCPAGGVIVELAAGELNSVGAGTTLVAANNAAHHLTTRTSTGPITINAKLGFGSFTFAFERAPAA